MSTLFSLGGLPVHPQNPHSWRTILSLLVWPLWLGRPYQENNVPAGIARKVIEARKPPHPTPRQGGDNRGSLANSRRNDYRIWSVERDCNPHTTAHDLLYIYWREIHPFVAKLVTQNTQSVSDSLDDNSPESLLSLLSPGSLKSIESLPLPDEESSEPHPCCFPEWSSLVSAHHHHHDHQNRSRRSCPLLPSLNLLPAGNSLSAAFVTDPSGTS